MFIQVQVGGQDGKVRTSGGYFDKFVLGTVVCESIPEVMLVHALGRQCQRSFAMGGDGDGALRPAGVSTISTGGINSSLCRYISIQYSKVRSKNILVLAMLCPLVYWSMHIEYAVQHELAYRQL